MRSQRLKKRKKSQRKRRKAKRVANEKRKAVERINIKLLRRQHMIHKYINNKQIQEYITIENEIEEQIQKLQHQIRDTCQLKEQYFIDNEGEHYAPYVMSNQLYNSNYNDWLKRQK